MEPSTTRQLWMIDDLLKDFKRKQSSIAATRKLFPTKEAASKAIEALMEIQSREANRINKLPVEMRLWAHKELTDKEWQLIKDGQYESKNI